MTENVLGRLFEHNNWANVRLIQACSALGDEQLDAAPVLAAKGSIRDTLWHLTSSQQGYLALLTGAAPQFDWQVAPAFGELQEAASITGVGLLALARGESGQAFEAQLQTEDGYYVKPWIVMVQVINHATRHREQICGMLRSLGVTPPDLDGWTYGEFTNALTPIQHLSRSRK
jgi:uncharacterized damage-inducible protein DinB